MNCPNALGSVLVAGGRKEKVLPLALSKQGMNECR
jgi:hypothetical protein